MFPDRPIQPVRPAQSRLQRTVPAPLSRLIPAGDMLWPTFNLWCLLMPKP